MVEVDVIELQAQRMAAVRTLLAPEPNEPRAILVTCSQCGTSFWAWKRQRQRTCPDCSATRQAEATRSMRDRAGPAYIKAAAKQRAFWVAECDRLGL